MPFGGKLPPTRRFDPTSRRDALILGGPDREGAGHDKQNRCNGE